MFLVVFLKFQTFLAGKIIREKNGMLFNIVITMLLRVLSQSLLFMTRQHWSWSLLNSKIFSAICYLPFCCFYYVRTCISVMFMSVIAQVLTLNLTSSHLLICASYLWSQHISSRLTAFPEPRLKTVTAVTWDIARIALCVATPASPTLRL